MYQMCVPSPIGMILIQSDGENIVSIDITKKRIKDHPDALTKVCALELNAYFMRKKITRSLPFSTKGTVFQKKVWRAISRIPLGSTKTYAEIAGVVGTPKAFRAVGSACGNNPLLILTPCHRVISSDGSLGGYRGGIKNKKWLLEYEKKKK